MSDTGRPNILVICSDQHHPRMLGCQGHPLVKTPNLDRLAARGAIFNNAFCSSPQCTPSRMSFITGRYAHQVRSWAIGMPLSRDEMTWARRLDQAGIPSTMLGKMDFCGEYQDGGFTDHIVLRERPAFDSVPRSNPYSARLKEYQRPGLRKNIENACGRTEDLLSDGGLADEHNQKIGNYDHDRIITSHALEYLKKKGEKNEAPWALYVGFLFPHYPFVVPEKYLAMYDPAEVEMPFDFRIPNESLHPEVRHFQQTLCMEGLSENGMCRAIAAYYAMITCLDDLIGEILDELERQGMAEHTYVIYTSDHGEAMGEHGLLNKQSAYTGSVGVPLILSGPGVPVLTVDQPVSLVDMYPTIMEMAGLEAEPDRPGHSWFSFLDPERSDYPDHVFAEHQSIGFRNDWYMIVRKGYKYIYYVNNRPSLFDLKNDPQELTDLAGHAEYQPLCREFEAILRTIVDPEAVSMEAKKDLGLLTPEGVDYTDFELERL